MSASSLRRPNFESCLVSHRHGTTSPILLTLQSSLTPSIKYRSTSCAATAVVIARLKRLPRITCLHTSWQVRHKTVTTDRSDRSGMRMHSSVLLHAVSLPTTTLPAHKGLFRRSASFHMQVICSEAHMQVPIMSQAPKTGKTPRHKHRDITHRGIRGIK